MPSNSTCPDCGADGSECAKTACGYDCVLFNGRDPAGDFCDCSRCKYWRRREWAVIRADVSDSESTVALPTSWLVKDWLLRCELITTTRDREEAGIAADWLIGPGSHVDALRDIGDLHGSVNDIYTLVDEGYINATDAISAFQIGDK